MKTQNLEQRSMLSALGSSHNLVQNQRAEALETMCPNAPCCDEYACVNYKDCIYRKIAGESYGR